MAKLLNFNSINNLTRLEWLTLIKRILRARLLLWFALAKRLFGFLFCSQL